MKNIKKFGLSTFLIFVSIFTDAKAENYSKIRIWLDGKSSIDLAKTGIDLAETEYKKDTYYESDFSEHEIKRIQAAGFRYDILIQDVVKFYRDRNLESQASKSSKSINDCIETPDYPKPAHFYLGSMGGYLTYQQLMNNLDSMAILFPNLITAQQPISSLTTVEGRSIYYLKISDNPVLDEAEPEVLYTALHHAREPISMTSDIYYMWYLLENYASDTAIQNLVNNTEMYFIPCINPDGFVYNVTTNPIGGGMWRKNRQVYTTGTYGVDLNRNYGKNWAYDDIGSSPDSNSQTFRGDSAFSERETQMMRSFCSSRNFKFTLNYHAYGNFLLYPWGHIPNYYCPDSLRYKIYSNIITKYNNYKAGTSNQTLNYLVNGGSEDWMYGEQGLKPKIFAMLPEVGNGIDGFWPATSRIIDLCKGNMYANIMTAKLAGRYGTAKDLAPLFLSPQNSFLTFDFSLIGLDTTGNYTVSIVPITSNITAGNPKVYSGLSFNQVVTDSIAVTYSPSIISGDRIDYLLTVNNGLYAESDTITKYFGASIVEFYDDGSTVSNWDAFNIWGTVSNTFVSAPSSITDSPFGNYLANSYNELFLIDTINLVGSNKAIASFYAKWELEDNIDYVQFQVSTDSGATWLALCGNYTNSGSVFQGSGVPLFDGYQYTWVKEEISLDAYLGQNILLRFLMVTDGFAQYDGFYFDDFKVVKNLQAGLGLTEIQTDFSLSLYPNPADENFTLSYKTTAPATFKLIDLYGKTVGSYQLTGKQGEQKINCNELKKGIYFYRLESEKFISNSKKLIIQ